MNLCVYICQILLIRQFPGSFISNETEMLAEESKHFPYTLKTWPPKRSHSYTPTYSMQGGDA